ncbi:UNVERIFIED_CONTAM: hypothetical protein PYX00_009489 [Menopon gallinae]|uniref:TBC1 domain family member 23 n=1 Tax=Menopon gallinae TaxID=328185 RepID=A0AAW2HBI4_9NEOP
MADEDDDSTWVLDLEAALLENCSVNKINSICNGRFFPDHLRPDAWQACLGVKNKEDQLTNFNEIYDLPEQEILRQDCQNIVEKLGNDDYDKVSVVSDVESILTYYSKTNGVKYQKGNGWIELLLPILSLKQPKSETYNIFEAIVNLYIPKNNTKKATPDLYAEQWFKSLFSGTCYFKVVQSIWDLYFQQNNPFFIFFLSLVIVLNWRDHVITFKNESREKIIESIMSIPVALEYKDVSDFCSLAHYYALRTPRSFKKELYDVLFSPNDACSSISLKQPLSQTLCLPVTTSELVENAWELEFLDESVESIERVRFFLVDCRPAEQYNAGHLPTAFHLDCNLMIQEPSAFNVAVQGLLSAQKQSIAANSNAGGKHLCFLGSGRDEEDQYTHMVVASFLQKNTQYISMLTGGYEAIHEYFGNDMSDCLEDHDHKKCLVCTEQSSSAVKKSGSVNQMTSESGHDLFGKISEVIKTKSADFKEKFIEYIVNPSNSMENVKHVSPKDKVGKIYRNLAPVFSIDDENVPDSLYYGEDEEEEISEEIVSLSEYLKSDKTIAHFKCLEVKENGYMYDSYLLVTNSHIIVLRELSKREDSALLVVKRPLTTIVRITSKKRRPDLITFKYGNPDGDLTQISDMDRFLIQKATAATQLISQQIRNLS